MITLDPERKRKRRNVDLSEIIQAHFILEGERTPKGSKQSLS